MTDFLAGRYDASLVVLSYLIATLAAYSAIDLAHRIRSNRERQWLWIALGASAMGMGIWSMHFIGMQAFTLPIPLGYDLAKTLGSLAAAVGVAALALTVASRERLKLHAVIGGAVLMGAGICAMHYTGMAALEMQPGILWIPWLLALSGLVAVIASAAALWIVFGVQAISARYRLFARFAAAAVMGLAVVGTHYVGMAAAQFPAASVCGARDSLTGAWTAGPVSAITIVLTLLIMGLAAYDLRLQARLAEERLRRQQELRAHRLALYDDGTGLRNRASFQQEIVRLMQRCRREIRQFDLFYGSVRFPDVAEDLLDECMRALAARLKSIERDGDFLVRFGKTEFALLHPRRHLRDLPESLRADLLAACTEPLRLGKLSLNPQAYVGIGTFPDHGETSRELLTAAARTPQPDEPAENSRVA